MSTRSLVFVLTAAALFGCEPAPASVDASLAPDAGVSPDAALALDAPLADDAALAPDVFAVLADAAPAVCASDSGVAGPTFRELYAEILAPYRCSECHAAASHWPTTLDLSSPELAYASLLGPVGCDDTTPRVTPCDPSASTFAIVPTARGEPCGGRHTYAGVNPMGIVTSEEAARIDAWILAGAPY
jgi:hypothetical protein